MVYSVNGLKAPRRFFLKASRRLRRLSTADDADFFCADLRVNLRNLREAFNAGSLQAAKSLK